MILSHTIASPIGLLSMQEENGFITGLSLQKETAVTDSPVSLCPGTGPETELLKQTRDQLEQYFAGQRTHFALPVLYRGTPFYHRVWDVLCTIPYGQTRSYQEIAALTGSPKAVRAVGQANHSNPLLILVPCHRVIHKNGDIRGYACGDTVKQFLLKLEGAL